MFEPQSKPLSNGESSAELADGSGKPPRRNAIWDLVDNPWVVLALLFFVMAILGLPVLWKSRGFSTLAKVVLSVVVTLYTALAFWLVFLVLRWSWSVISEFLWS